MKATILTLLLALGSLHAEYHHNHPQIFYPQYQPPITGQLLGTGEHELRGISADGIIEIEDGTQFKAIPSHKGAMKYWNYYDQITFCPNLRPFAGSEFYVMNETNGEYFKANIWASAAIQNSYSMRLIEIDKRHQEILLVTQEGMQMRWKIDAADFDYLRFWKLGDVIVIGKNNNWFATYFSNNWFATYFSNDDYILVSYSATNDILYVRGTPKPL